MNLRLEEGVLRFHDPMTDEYLLTHLEENRARQAEAQARREAEVRLAELKARLQALQQSSPPRPERADPPEG